FRTGRHPRSPSFPYTTLFRSVDAAAYRTVQECMTNALRYASPPRLRVTVRRTADAEDVGEWLVIEAENPVAEPAEPSRTGAWGRSEEHTSELQSRENLVCRLL